LRLRHPRGVPGEIKNVAVLRASQPAGRARHTPVIAAPSDKPLIVFAKVRDPSGVQWVRLRHRSVHQHQHDRTWPMLPTGEKDEYRAVLPAEDLVPTGDVVYFIEAMDQRGTGRIHPDLNTETPYIVVKLQR
jgi:hypothetical protein